MIELVNVSKTLGDFNLKDINLKVNNNEYFVILGPTGTGKTVILETIAGLYKPDKGKILFHDKNVTHIFPEERNIGFVYQDYALFPHLSVRENIIFGLKIRKYNNDIIEKKVKEITKLLGIGHLLKRYPSTLSGGEQQRVAIARVLVLSPEILLLDEPLSALDPRTKENFQYELKKIHNRFKTTTIHITHDFNEAMALADRIGVMCNGQIIQIGSPEDVFHKPSDKFVANFVGIENIFSGEIIEKDNMKFFKTGDVLFNTITDEKGQVHAAIRPEEIFLAEDVSGLSTQNSLKCTIKDILPKDNLVKIKLDGGIPLTAFITKQSAKEMKLGLEREIFAGFKTTAVHVFK